MLRSRAVLLLAAALLLPATGSLAAELGIVTGSDKGTYYQFGLNLQQLLKPHNIALNVSTSKGSVENIYAVYKRPRTQLGIVQADVLAFVARVENDPALKRIAKKIKMVFPLYNEEVHLLGRRDITDFDDLSDKRVAVGREGSGTYLTARLLFKVSEVQPREMVPIDTDEALAELKAGRIDAMFYVAGYPVKLLAEHVADADGLALVPISDKSIREFYPPAEIPARTYPWQPAPVGTVAVKAVVVSYDFQRGDCEQVGKLAALVAGNQEWLKANGHPKWRTVDLDFPLKGWEQYECVRRHLRKPMLTARPKSSANPVLDAIKDMLGE
jgi:TRAP transporter TAXI family solute receptor